MSCKDDFFNYMKAAGYTDVERGERGSTEEHLTVTQFKVAQEQQRLEDVTAQIAQTEQALDTAQAAVEKKQKELQSLQKQTKEQRTTALTVQEIRSMGKKTITGNITLTPSECSTLKDYAVNGILARQKTAAWKISCNKRKRVPLSGNSGMKRFMTSTKN